MKRSWNPLLWAGFALAIAGAISYPLFFIRFPMTRDFPWANLMLLAVAIGMLAVGARRAYQHPEKYHGRVSGPILGSLSLLLMGLFLVSIFYLARKVPASAGAPRPGQAAPDFTLPDASGNMVTLSSLVSSPFASNDWPAQGSAQASGANGKTAGAVLIFYRGYW